MKYEDFSGAYETPPPSDFFDSNPYAFATKSQYIPHPLIGFSLNSARNRFTEFTSDGGRAIDDVGDSPSIADLRNSDVPIFMYGGSVMFGSYALSNSRTIPGYLSQSLDSKVFNFAMPGSIFMQNFSHFFNLILPRIQHLKAFYFILLFGYNEYTSLARLNLKNSEILLGYPQLLFGNSKWGKFAKLHPRIKKLESMRKSNRPNEEIIEMISQLNALSNLIFKLGGTPVLVMQPNLHTSMKQLYGVENVKFDSISSTKLFEFRKQVSELLSDFSNYLDLTGLFSTVERQVFVDGVHLGCFGNRTIADSILKMVRL